MFSSTDKLIIIWSKRGEIYRRLKKLERKNKNSYQGNQKRKLLTSDSTSLQIIDSQKKFDNLHIAEGGKIIILAELEWEGKSMSDFYGLELIGKIRFEKGSDAPVAVVSILNISQLKKIMGGLAVFKEVIYKNVFCITEFDLGRISKKRYHFNKMETHRRVINHFDKREKLSKRSKGHMNELLGMLYYLIFSVQRNMNGNTDQEYSLCQIRELWKIIYHPLNLLMICTNKYMHEMPTEILKSIIEVNECVNFVQQKFVDEKKLVDLSTLRKLWDKLTHLKVPLRYILERLKTISKKIKQHETFNLLD